jgi:RNA polymerase sigma-70 factor (ECF subfamily)
MADHEAPTSGTSPSLLVRVKCQDAEAWRRLVELYSPLVYSWCRRGGLAPSDAADVMQETFRAVVVGIEGYRHEAGGSFRGWLRTIVTNKIRDLFRRRQSEAAATGGTEAQRRLLETPAEETSDLTPAGPGERIAILHRAAELVRAEFEPHTWQAFWLTAIEGQSAAEAGQKLGMQANAVRQAKYKVLHRLRQELSGLEDGTAGEEPAGGKMP